MKWEVVMSLQRRRLTFTRWYDDVVFKNQTKDEPKPVKRFINDTTRNDFHKKFLNKYVK